jgi:2-haloacid dehalogenase
VPAPPRPPIVVFDLGGVLIDWSPRRLYDKIFSDPTQVDWFLREICTQAWHEQVDAGAKPADIEPALQARFPAYAAEISAFHARFAEMFGEPHHAMIDVLERLHAAGTPLYALTNWDADTFVWARRTYPFLARFRDIVVSGEERVMKPDPRIFQVLFRRGGFSPGDAVLIDDRASNVEAARALGMHAIHHADAAATVKALGELGHPLA